LHILVKDILAERASQERRITTAMDIRQGEVFKKSMNGMNFLFKKIVGKTVVLESQEDKRQILTEVRTSTSASFYLKRTGEES